MCPDRQILSVYLDGELPSPWKEEMAAHLSKCAECRTKLEQYRKLSAFITGDREDLSGARDRVWLELGKSVSVPGRTRTGGRRFWRQSVAVPLPALIASAAVLVLTFTLAVTNFTAKKAAPVDTTIAAGINLDVQEIVPVADMNSFLQYLGDEETPDFLIIRLPETRTFSNPGQPTIIKASDYSRSNQN
jgi:anti-sigma factor RsiW